MGTPEVANSNFIIAALDCDDLEVHYQETLREVT